MRTRELVEAMVARFEERLDSLLESEPIRFDDQLREKLPTKPGVYRVSLVGSDATKSLYVGQSKNLRNRVRGDHFQNADQRWSVLRHKLIATGRGADEAGATAYLREKCQVQFVRVDEDLGRKRLEHFAVALLNPILNDLLSEALADEASEQD